MKKRRMLKMAHLPAVLALGTLASPVTSAAASIAAPASTSPQELIIKVRDASVDELMKLTFFELNTLKNAVFAARGYNFANDRTWLRLMFCAKPTGKVSGQFCKPEDCPNKSAQFRTWVAQRREDNDWDLASVRFPACADTGAPNSDQQKAIANIRVATFKKVEHIGLASRIERALRQDLPWMADDDDRLGNCGWFLGWVACTQNDQPESRLSGWQESLTRDVLGTHRLLQLIRHPEQVDPTELLGLYLGDVAFLRSVVEAQNGKQFKGVLGWEISQIAGVLEPNPSYDPVKLPVQTQTLLKMLDDVAEKIRRSDLNDLPPSLRSRKIDASGDPENNDDIPEGYRAAAC